MPGVLKDGLINCQQIVKHVLNILLAYFCVKGGKNFCAFALWPIEALTLLFLRVKPSLYLPCLPLQHKALVKVFMAVLSFKSLKDCGILEER